MRTPVLLVSALLVLSLAQSPWIGGGGGGGGGSGGFGLVANECECALPKIRAVKYPDGCVSGPVCVWAKDKTGADDCTWTITKCNSTENDLTVMPVEKPVPPPTNCNTMCPASFAPVCGDDGKVYGNDCELSLASCTQGVKINTVPCPSKTIALPVAQGIEVPVSLTDACACEKMIRMPPIRKCLDNTTFEGPGACQWVADAAGSLVCRQTWRSCPTITQAPPTKTAQSESLLPIDPPVLSPGDECECRSRITRQPPITTCPNGDTTGPDVCRYTLLESGEKSCAMTYKTCDAPPPPPRRTLLCTVTPCLKIYKPVCGTDGTTYGNDCELNNAKCSSQVDKAYDGECKDDGIAVDCFGPGAACGTKRDSSCAPIDCFAGNQVCGSDGKTYSSDCALQNAACASKSSLEKVGNGPCNDTDISNANPCDSTQCPKGTGCVVHTPKCTDTLVKCAPFARCVPVVFDGVDPPQVDLSVAPVDPCDTLKCPTGSKCIKPTTPTLAQTASCQAVDLSIDPPILLPETSGKLPPPPQTTTVDRSPVPPIKAACEGIKCPDGTQCVAQPVQCFKDDCPPSTTCQVVNNFNGTAPPTKKDPCANVQCGNGTVCVPQQVACKAPPCDTVGLCEPQPAVDPIKPPKPVTRDPCIGMKCAKGFVCISSASDPPSGSCVANDCLFTNCSSDDPVCGTDGNTYPSRCAITNANCNGARISVAYAGACRVPCDEKNGTTVCSAGAINMECNVKGGYCAPKKEVIDPCSALTCSGKQKCRLLPGGSVSCQDPAACDVTFIAACAQNRTAQLMGTANVTDCAIRALVVACASDSGCNTDAYCKSIPAKCAVDVCAGAGIPTRTERQLADMVTAFAYPRSTKQNTQSRPTGLIFTLGAICVAMGVALIVVGMLYRRVSRQLAAVGNAQQTELVHRLI